MHAKLRRKARVALAAFIAPTCRAMRDMPATGRLPARSGHGPSRLRRAWTAGLQRHAFKDPLHRALFHFIAAMGRAKHEYRLFLASMEDSASHSSAGALRRAMMVSQRCPRFFASSSCLLHVRHPDPVVVARELGFQHNGRSNHAPVSPRLRKWIIARLLVPLFAFLAVVQSHLSKDAIFKDYLALVQSRRVHGHVAL